MSDENDNMSCSSCNFDIGEMGGGGSTSNCCHLFCYQCIKTKVEMSTSGEVGCCIEYPDGATCRGYFTLKEIESFVGEEVFQDFRLRLGEAGAGLSEEILDDETSNNSYDEEDDEEEDDDESYDSDDCVSSSKMSSKLEEASSRPLTSEEMKTSWGQVAAMIKVQMIAGHSYSEAIGIIDKFPLWLANREISCMICREDSIPIGEGVILKDCLHTFCRDCLRGHIQHADGSPEVGCPFIEDDYKCDSFLKPKELRSLSSNEEYKKHYEDLAIKGLESLPNIYNCRTPNCGYMIFVEDDEYGASGVQFLCPKCSKRNCTSCKVIHDSGCQEYWQRLEDEENERLRIIRELQEREDQERRDRLNRLEQQRLERLSEAEIQAGLANRTYEKCPNCAYICHKFTGCNHVVCGKCKHKFNWGGT